MFLQRCALSLKKNAVPTLISYADSSTNQAQIPEVPDPIPPTTSSFAVLPPESTPSPNPEPSRTPPRHADINISQTMSSTPRRPTNGKCTSRNGRLSTPRNVLTPRKRKLMNRLQLCSREKLKLRSKNNRLILKQTRNKPISKENLILGLREYLPESVTKFVEMQLNHSDSRKRKPWTHDERQMSLTMSYVSPK